MADDNEVREAVEDNNIDKAVQRAMLAVAEGCDDVKIEFELGGIFWRLRVEAVGVVGTTGEDDNEEG